MLLIYSATDNTDGSVKFICFITKTEIRNPYRFVMSWRVCPSVCHNHLVPKLLGLHSVSWHGHCTFVPLGSPSSACTCTSTRVCGADRSRCTEQAARPWHPHRTAPPNGQKRHTGAHETHSSTIVTIQPYMRCAPAGRHILTAAAACPGEQMTAGRLPSETL